VEEEEDDDEDEEQDTPILKLPEIAAAPSEQAPDSTSTSDHCAASALVPTVTESDDLSVAAVLDCSVEASHDEATPAFRTPDPTVMSDTCRVLDTPCQSEAPELAAAPREQAPDLSCTSDVGAASIAAPSKSVSDMVGEFVAASSMLSIATTAAPSDRAPDTEEESSVEAGKGDVTAALGSPEPFVASDADQKLDTPCEFKAPEHAVALEEQAPDSSCASDACTVSALAPSEPVSETIGELGPNSQLPGDAATAASSDPAVDMARDLEAAGATSGDDSETTFSVGDPVCVYRRSVGAWLRDGVVVQVLAEPTTMDGLHLPAGAVKVLYDDAGYAKWIPPAAFSAELKHADFIVGDDVSVLTPNTGIWATDGSVVEVLAESATVDGVAMPVGSVKVTYAGGDMARWIPPEAFQKELRAQRSWSGEGSADQPGMDAGPAVLDVSPSKASAMAAHVADSLVRTFSFLSPIMGSGYTDDADDDDDAYIVSSMSGLARSIPGRYRRVGECNWKPKYCNERGAIIFFDDHWKMNVKDDTLHWCYEVRGSTEEYPPAQAWQAYHLFGDSGCPVPTLARASEIEVLAVSGVTGPARGVNGRYVEVGYHNMRPKYQNRSGAIIYFDDYWKMNNRNDMLAWHFGVKDATGLKPPGGDWEAHWSCHDEQSFASVRLSGELAAGA